MYAAKRILAAVFVAVLALSVTFAAFTATDNAAASSASAASVPSMHRSYHEASDIVLAVCELRYNTTGGAVSRFKVERVFGGAMAAGDTFTLARDAVEGESYLLYLADGGGADYAEDEAGYVSITDELITVKGDTAYCGGAGYSLSSIISDFEEQRSVLTVPAQSFYYGDISSLADACDDIVLCRVTASEGPAATQCRSFVKGESVMSTAGITYLTLMVENSFGGEHSYGEVLKVAVVPAHTQSVINADDLTPVRYYSPVKPAQVGGHYVFFLKHSEDAKSDYCFAVNPYQSYVELDGDSIIRPYYNKAFEGVSELCELAAILSEKFGF